MNSRGERPLQQQGAGGGVLLALRRERTTAPDDDLPQGEDDTAIRSVSGVLGEDRCTSGGNGPALTRGAQGLIRVKYPSQGQISDADEKCTRGTGATGRASDAIRKEDWP
ncbi:hypothetical protein CYMTET_46758 [Cymbomonas tetramitiformis]|uniref:Uncharacterized protein n=1 Tax=Cymbomonas tetramitiformis TaxID=36881 RepID=A0AAE0BWR4_9CHLO|nr:hypothetical protein CYMTET_46758 [Cymbomonas tetramitiformis]